MTKQDARNKEMVTNAIMKYMNANGKAATLLDEIKIAEYIHRAESTLSRLAEMECDSYFYGIYWKDGVNPKQERAEERIEKYISDIDELSSLLRKVCDNFGKEIGNRRVELSIVLKNLSELNAKQG